MPGGPLPPKPLNSLSSTDLPGQYGHGHCRTVRLRFRRNNQFLVALDHCSPATAESTGLFGEAPSFMAMLEHVSRAAKLAKPVLVIGERGTGKELIASRLHYLSERWEQPLVKVNCAALTESLLETELFGHQAGAFTGADANPHRPIRAGRRRHARARRARHDSAAHAGEDPARDRVRRVPARRRLRDAADRRADRRRHERAPAATRGARALPPRPARPTGLRRDPRAAAARATRGHRHARVSLRGQRHEGAATVFLPRASRRTRKRRCSGTPGPAMSAS